MEKQLSSQEKVDTLDVPNPTSTLDKIISSSDLHMQKISGDKSITVVSPDKNPSIPQWLLTLLENHQTTFEVSDNKWCAKIANELGQSINPDQHPELNDDNWGYDITTVSGQYKKPSSEGYSFHALSLVTISAWDESEQEYTPYQFITLDLTAPVMDQSVDALAITCSSLESLKETLSTVYRVQFSI